MTEPNFSAAVTVGPWVAVVGPRAWLIADIDPTSDAIRVICLELVRAGEPADRIAEALGRTESFAIARVAGGGLSVLVAGEATVTVSTARDGDRCVDGRSGAPTASSFKEFTGILLGAAVLPLGEPAYPIETGVMPAARIAVTVLPAALPSAALPSAAAPEASPGFPSWLSSMASQPAAPAPTAVAPPAVRPSAPSADDRLSETRTPPRDDDHDSDLPAWMPRASQPVAPFSPTPHVAPSPAVSPTPSPTAPEPAAPWIPAPGSSLSDLSWAFGGTSNPVPAQVPSAQAPLLRVPSWAPAATAPVASDVEAMQSTVSRDAPRPGAVRPAGRIRLSTGEVITLDGGVVLGRAPGDGRTPGDKDPGARYRLRLDNPDQTLSRQHVAVRVEGIRIVVADLESANGTWVTPPGGQRRPLAKGGSCPVVPGTVVHLDEKTWFEVLS